MLGYHSNRVFWAQTSVQVNNSYTVVRPRYSSRKFHTHLHLDRTR
jgi:hypothetical protein